MQYVLFASKSKLLTHTISPKYHMQACLGSTLYLLPFRILLDNWNMRQRLWSFSITKRLRDTWQVDTWQILKHGRWWFTYRCVICDSSEWNDWYNVWQHRNNDIPETTSSHVQCQQHRRLHARTLDQAVLKLTRIMCAVQHNQVTCWRMLTSHQCDAETCNITQLLVDEWMNHFYSGLADNKHSHYY